MEKYKDAVDLSFKEGVHFYKSTDSFNLKKKEILKLNNKNFIELNSQFNILSEKWNDIKKESSFELLQKYIDNYEILNKECRRMLEDKDRFLLLMNLLYGKDSELTNEYEYLRELFFHKYEAEINNCFNLINLITENNFKLVIKVLHKKNFNKDQHYPDFISEGFLGLRYAVINFNLLKDVRFSTYAFSCIWGFMSNWRNDNKSILHIPRYLAEKDLPELLDININSNNLKNKKESPLNKKHTNRELCFFAMQACNIVSIDNLRRGAASDSEKFDIIDSRNNEALKIGLFDIINIVRDGLIELFEINSKKATALVLYNNLYESCPESILKKIDKQTCVTRSTLKKSLLNKITLDNVGDLMGVTRERVRQINIEACGMLKRIIRTNTDFDK